MLRLRQAAVAADLQPASSDDWRILRLLSVYRLLLVTLLLILQQSSRIALVFDQIEPRRFQYIGFGYAAAAVLLMVLVRRRRPGLTAQSNLHFLIDLVVITGLIYECGGVPTGLGVLLITPAFGCAMLVERRLALFQAALASVTMIGEEIVRQYGTGYDASDFAASGFLGLMLFATSAGAYTVAQRARQSEAIAQRVGTEYEDLAQLNRSIVETMRTGLLVVDRDGRIASFNHATAKLLARFDDLRGESLERVVPPLMERLRLWLTDPGTPEDPLLTDAAGTEVVPRFSRLLGNVDAPVLVLLDDATRLREQVQQMKLASLGRLSASIAHEIRNPLAAIVNAGQLLDEALHEPSGGDMRQNLRLLSMIQRHSERIDKIIRDILALSRRDLANPTDIPLKAWLMRSTSIYQEAQPDARRRIELGYIPGGISIRFDPHHLQQVLFNLWDNAFVHGSASGGETPTVFVEAGFDESGRPWLETSDDGPGIAPDLQEKMFEPFFTTAQKGTGLGLYLAREICEYNQARISYRQRARGACFRIVFVQQEGP